MMDQVVETPRHLRREPKVRADGPADRRAGDTAEAARIYYLAPWLSGPIEHWDAQFERIAAMGFSHVLIAWPFGGPGNVFATTDLDRFGFNGRLPAVETLKNLAGECARWRLKLCLDLVIDRAAANGGLSDALPDCWRSQRLPWADPRTIETDGLVKAAFDDPQSRHRLVGFWRERLAQWVAAGVSGVRCHDAQAVDLPIWREILTPLRDRAARSLAIAWMPGAPRHALAQAGRVFDLVTSSVAWWDGRAPWLVEEYEALSADARLIGFPDDPFGRRLAGRASSARAKAAHRLALAAATNLTDAWLMPMGFELGTSHGFLDSGTAQDVFAAMRAEAPFDLASEITQANAAMASRVTGRQHFTLLTGEGAPTSVILRSHEATGGEAEPKGELIVFNPDLARPAPVPLQALAAKAGMRLAVPGATLELSEGGAVTALLERAEPVRAVGAGSLPNVASPRIAIEAVSPVLDGGRFAVKRLAGDTVTVEADIFADGHEVLAAEVLFRAEDEEQWSRAPMTYLVNDRWRGSFPLLRIGRHVFAIEAWWSHFGTFSRDLTKKRDAGLDLSLEIAEGRILLEETLATATGDARGVISDHLRALDEPGADGAALLLAPALAQAMEAADTRPFATGGDAIYPIEADRRAGAFSSWYELFPRSITDDRRRHGTFRDVIGRLPAVKAMGFDVLYFPPIHPIGRTNRKGPNNTLTPGPDDPGSPYAIGSSDGGHEAIHPELGSREDFRLLVREAAAHGLEIALDFAIQCSPDHPWLKQHPGWFQWRPDGSMKYAENPPKKYQDIVNVDFYGPDAKPGLWLELRDVVQGWVDEGVRIFRVDNPHTKPFPFWEWLIADIRSRDPGVLFLAEAFTRPKVMYRLGKVGFSQSYTYFTWRNTKAELIAYLTELNQAPARDLFRPHFFVNTPDINPLFLQTSGRPGFLIRAALAATLSGLWGVYSGFELCESAPMPGKEEYLDSEKYELRPRDWQMPGNIIAEISALNAIRRSHPALQSHLGVTFYNAFNDQVLFYGKRVPGDRDMVVVAVSLDPHGAQAATIELPLWEFGLPDSGAVAAEDLMHGHRFVWTGKTQTIELAPHQPFAIWRITPIGAASV